jgi:hypothetical protein
MSDFVAFEQWIDRHYSDAKSTESKKGGDKQIRIRQKESYGRPWLKYRFDFVLDRLSKTDSQAQSLLVAMVI